MSIVDPNVVAVAEQLHERSRVGYLKYKTTTTRQDLSTLDWLQHLQEELLDAAVYIQRLKKDFTNES
jgi:hypothetical protein